MKKQIVRLTECDLHKIIKESVNKILYENNIYPNNESNNILNIVNTAIANSNFEISNYKLTTKNRKSRVLKYNGDLCFSFYDENDTNTVNVIVSIEADYTFGEKQTYLNPGHSEECNAYIISVNNIELCSNDKTLNIKDNDLIQKLYDIIEDKLYDYLDDEVYEIIIRDMEDYYGYIEYQRCKYDERMDDR